MKTFFTWVTHDVIQVQKWPSSKKVSDTSAIDIGREGSGNWDGPESRTIMAVMTRKTGHMTSTLGSHPEQPGRLAWQRGSLQTTRTSGRAILVTSCRPGHYFHLMFIFELKWKTNIIGQNMQQINLSYINLSYAQN
jgi:hypothetical protein